MRRVDINGRWALRNGTERIRMVEIRENDYRLMRVVVKAAEQSLRDPHFRGVFASSVQKAVDAFNATGSRMP